MHLTPAAVIALALTSPAALAVTATETVLYNFPAVSFVPGVGGPIHPGAAPMQASDGNFYGTSVQGGANNTSTGQSGGQGTVWKVTAGGTGSVLYSFGANATDARYPNSRLVEVAGVLYGTTMNGGAFHSDRVLAGDGTVFKISLTGSQYAVLHSFEMGTELPYPSSLTLGPDGALYGVTLFGGTSNKGTVFRIATSGSFTTVHSFSGAPLDGAYPGALTLGDDGALYGLTGSGGAFDKGALYRITVTGEVTMLHAFGGCAEDARLPQGLAQGADGNFYGSSAGGGNDDGGTIWVVTPDGTETLVHRFVRAAGGGIQYPAGLALGPDDNLYGVSGYGGASELGTFFMVTPTGAYMELHAFGSGADAVEPFDPPMLGTDGAFYGITNSGGSNDTGALYRIALAGLTPATYPAAINGDTCPVKSGSGGSGTMRPADIAWLLAFFAMLLTRRVTRRFP